MKNHCIFVVALIAIYSLSVLAQSHNSSWGERQPRDTLIHREIFYKKGNFLRIVKSDFKFSSDKTITQIRVTDQYVNNKGGYATLLSGGPGLKDVKIHGKSRHGHGFNFIIEIYGV